MAWQRLSTRVGKKPPSGPYEGVPPHLVAAVLGWIANLFPEQGYGGICNAKTLRYFAMMNEIAVKLGTDDFEVLQTVLGRCGQDPVLCLDVVDSLLHFRGPGGADAVAELSALLTAGRSAWSTAPDGHSLVRHTDPTASEQVSRTIKPNDVASDELSHAWDKVFGRHADPSDAWDHSIEAVEAVLIPIVCPRKDKANLGSVAGDLKSAPHSWHLALNNAGGSGGVETLEAMLRLMWPNPDRHQDGTPKQKPSQQEAAAVVQLAVTIVQWARSGALVKR